MADPAHAERAAYILRESAPRTAVEQAALAVVNEGKWVLWHAHDRDLGVLLLLSRAGLLRDKEHEEAELAADITNAGLAGEGRRADNILINTLSGIAEMAARRLERGDDAGEVASWLRAARDEAVNGR